MNQDHILEEVFLYYWMNQIKTVNHEYHDTFLLSDMGGGLIGKHYFLKLNWRPLLRQKGFSDHTQIGTFRKMTSTLLPKRYYYSSGFNNPGKMVD